MELRKLPTTLVVGFRPKVYVKKEYRGQGIATNLVDKAMEWRIERRCKIAQLTVDTPNHHAIELYKELQFEEARKVLRKEL